MWYRIFRSLILVYGGKCNLIDRKIMGDVKNNLG